MKKLILSLALLSTIAYVPKTNEGILSINYLPSESEVTTLLQNHTAVIAIPEKNVNIPKKYANTTTLDEETISEKYEVHGYDYATVYLPSTNGGYHSETLVVSENSSQEYLDSKITEIETRINESEIQTASSSNSLSGFEIGNSWTLKSSQKITWELIPSNSTEKFGDYADWVNYYTYTANNYTYHLITSEAYVTPNNPVNGKGELTNDDYRTSFIKYKMEKPGGSSSNVSLRDYQPKAQKPSYTITYASNVGTELGFDSDGATGNVSLGVSSSYSVAKESPVITDLGNMSKDLFEVKFQYQDVWGENTETGNYEYNIHQSMQSAISVWRTPKTNTTSHTALDSRVIEIVRDGLFFSNATADFYYDNYLTIK